MTIKQLRPFYSAAQLEQIYKTPYDSGKWTAHIERVKRTAKIIDNFAAAMACETIADLSCGDGAIVNSTDHLWDRIYLGDLSKNGFADYQGPIEKTIHLIPHVDMFVLSETIEHVKEPGALLMKIREKTDHLVLSTPHGEWHTQNPEHYWGWDLSGIAYLLREAGFKWEVDRAELFTPDSDNYYTFQIWATS